ncbi:DNA circularization N-terminal domain-containing protein [Paraburkholderia bryophila]|uniref:DNA circularization protein n=1 Tax=Paraburkholderia bryophila TaxID=420952 RepID=A0A329CNT3_9BURK|nr:DNA circularization N-terminal domain-containing protein [Paraburkholderia bryophila]RAS35867.1 DNA circularization protein [Paraburkholderia bryophila]
MSFWDSLQQASWRGIPFGVNAADARFGRRQAIHEYPNRDEVWVEDLGRAAGRINIRGFLLENDLVYNGGDVIDQREDMIGACETEGPGELVHPTLGRLDVSLLSFEVSERKEDGLMFEIHLSFIESGLQIFPSAATSTGDAVNQAADDANAAMNADFAKRAKPDLQQGAAVVQQAVSTATLWAGKAIGLVNGATSIFHMVTGLTGSYGRFAGGRTVGFSGYSALSSLQRTLGTAQQANATVQTLTAYGTQARKTVLDAADALKKSAESLGL